MRRNQREVSLEVLLQWLAVRVAQIDLKLVQLHLVAGRFESRNIVFNVLLELL
jgi:hypothetical protein